MLKHQSAHGRWRISSWSQHSSLLPIVRSDIAVPVSALLWNVQFGELVQHMLSCFPGLSSNDPLPWFRVCICSPRLHKTVSTNYVSANRVKSQTPRGPLNIFPKPFEDVSFFHSSVWHRQASHLEKRQGFAASTTIQTQIIFSTPKNNFRQINSHSPQALPLNSCSSCSGSMLEPGRRGGSRSTVRRLWQQFRGYMVAA